MRALPSANAASCGHGSEWALHEINLLGRAATTGSGETNRFFQQPAKSSSGLRGAIGDFFLAELSDEEIIDEEAAAKLDQSLAEPGDDVPLEEVRKRLGKYPQADESW